MLSGGTAWSKQKLTLFFSLKVSIFGILLNNSEQKKFRVFQDYSVFRGIDQLSFKHFFESTENVCF